MRPIDEYIFKFPKSIPNDKEGFCIFYPKKFPKVISLFEKLARKYFLKPKEFKKFIYAQQKELFSGFEKIKADYEKEKNKTDELIVKTDERLHKLFCFRFWIVNYGFSDGPMHNYCVERIRYYAEIAAEWETIDEKEKAVLDFERTLLQGDYTDLYLQNAFLGIKLHDFLSKSKTFQKFVADLLKNIKADNLKSCYKLIDDLLVYIETNKNKADAKKLHKLLEFPIESAKIRGDNLAVYNTIIHAFEFHEKSLELKQRNDIIKEKIKDIFKTAEKRLTKNQIEELKSCYQMSNLFKEAKDAYGSIDPYLLPFWFGILYELAARYKVPEPKTGPYIGHSAMFYLLAWYLPKDLKARIYTPDLTDFDLKKL